MSNGLATIRMLLGAMRAGIVVNPVNLLSQPAQMQYVLAHSDCRVVSSHLNGRIGCAAMLPALGRPIALIDLDPDAPEWPAQSLDASTKAVAFDAPDTPRGAVALHGPNPRTTPLRWSSSAISGFATRPLR